MPQRRGMATPMSSGLACTTDSAARGVNVRMQSADNGGTRFHGSRWSSRRAAMYRRVKDVLDISIMGREEERQGQRRPRVGTVGLKDSSLKQYRKVGFEDAKAWMERRLSNLKSGIPNSVASQLALGWAEQLSPELGGLDERIAEIEANNLARHYARTHVEQLGHLTKPRPDGVFRLLGGQMNSAASTETRLRSPANSFAYVRSSRSKGALCPRWESTGPPTRHRRTLRLGSATTSRTSARMRRTTSTNVSDITNPGGWRLSPAGS